MKLSCIVPAYNEEKRISNVLAVLLQNKYISEVIVVDDASTDGTREILKEISEIKVVSHASNQGKTQSILSGLENSAGELIMLIDSDLIGLDQDCLDRLILPVLEKKAEVTISLRKNALLIYKFLGVDFVSGERVFSRDILKGYVETLKNIPGFGLEVYLNEIIILKKLKVKIVKWDTVISPRKSAKIGFLLGSIGDMKMIKQILRTITIQKCVYQLYKLRKLSIDK